MVVSLFFFFFKQKTAYEMRISDWSSDVCSSDLQRLGSRALYLRIGAVVHHKALQLLEFGLLFLAQPIDRQKGVGRSARRHVDVQRGDVVGISLSHSACGDRTPIPALPEIEVIAASLPDRIDHSATGTPIPHLAHSR